MAPALPVGNFGTFPFRGQLWGKSLPASTCVTLVPKSKHKDAWKIQFALEVPVVVISGPNAMESISQSAGRSACRPRKVMWE
jgi:hypothetical protein